jgi:hypothetical protein
MLPTQPNIRQRTKLGIKPGGGNNSIGRYSSSANIEQDIQPVLHPDTVEFPERRIETLPNIDSGHLDDE